MSAAVAGDARALAAALAADGWSCGVEARAGLALLIVAADQLTRLSAPGERDVVLALAKRLGFTHVAVEPADQGTARYRRVHAAPLGGC